MAEKTMGLKDQESIDKGKKFEDYVEKHIFISSYYERLKKTHSYTQNIEDHVRDDNNPDFKFSNRKTKAEFWIEAKYSAKSYDGKIYNWEWENDKKKLEKKKRQLERYRECNKTTPVLLIIGMGENPSNVSSLYLIPLSEIKENCVYLEDAEKYKIDIKKPVTSEKIEQLITSWKPEEKKIEELPKPKVLLSKKTLIVTSIILLVLLGLFLFNQTKDSKKAKETITNDNQISNEAKEKEEIINHIKDYVLISNNHYKVKTHFFSADQGIENLKVTVFNKSKYMLEKVRIKISYLRKGEVVETAYINFTMLAPNDKKTNLVLESDRGTSIKCELDGYNSTLLGVKQL